MIIEGAARETVVEESGVPSPVFRLRKTDC